MDLVRGSVYVVESKGHKDRVVAVADDLLQIMRSYSTLISEIYPDSDYFFPRYDGDGPYTKRWTEEMFWRCFSMAGITAFEGPKPRVYDFRHRPVIVHLPLSAGLEDKELSCPGRRFWQSP